MKYVNVWQIRLKFTQRANQSKRVAPSALLGVSI